MKEKIFLSSLFYLIAATVFCTHGYCSINEESPLTKSEILLDKSLDEYFHKIENVAQYGGSDYKNAIYSARGITLSEAYEIAFKNPEISYFFFTKGYQMVLGSDYSDKRIFHYGDVVFFKGKPWWGSANGLADGYIKK